MMTSPSLVRSIRSFRFTWQKAKKSSSVMGLSSGPKRTTSEHWSFGRKSSACRTLAMTTPLNCKRGVEQVHPQVYRGLDIADKSPSSRWKADPRSAPHNDGCTTVSAQTILRANRNAFGRRRPMTSISGVSLWLGLLAACVAGAQHRARPPADRQPVPEKLVVLTFDDGCKSHASFIAPLLKEYGFGATFFVTEAFDSEKGWDRRNYMTWDDVRKLHAEGFEIGNHTRRHRKAHEQTAEEFRADVEHIERCFAREGIPAPRTFCYPAYSFTRPAVEVLQRKGYLFARRGTVPEHPYREGDLGFGYDPREDHPLLIPVAGAPGPNWKLENFVAAVQEARGGKIAVLAFHGVPDPDHPWVSTAPEHFRAYLEYLRDHGYRAIALRDLVKYVDPHSRPKDPLAPIERRVKGLSDVAH